MGGRLRCHAMTACAGALGVKLPCIFDILFLAGKWKLIIDNLTNSISRHGSRLICTVTPCFVPVLGVYEHVHAQALDSECTPVKTSQVCWPSKTRLVVASSKRGHSMASSETAHRSMHFSSLCILQLCTLPETVAGSFFRLILFARGLH